jgi:hypothetical protein
MCTALSKCKNSNENRLFTGIVDLGKNQVDKKDKKKKDALINL